MISIRQFRENDGAAVKELCGQLTSDLSGFDAERIANERWCQAIVMEDGGRVIGFGCLTFRLVPTKRYIGTLEDIVIDKDYCGKGLGRMLVDELILIAKKFGIKQIDLTSNPSRVAARKLYVSMGFSLVETDVFRLKL
jgi:ribosomal protein S18 acetylase RimI-like enzyme